MSTFDEAKINRRGAGSAGGGQFAAKHNSAPAGGLTAPTPQAPFDKPTPESVRTPEYSAHALEEMIRGIEHDENATYRLEFVQNAGNEVLVAEYYGLTKNAVDLMRVKLDDKGDVSSVETYEESLHEWGDLDFEGEQVSKFQTMLLTRRAELAGVRMGTRDTDGGYTGYRVAGELSTDGRTPDAADVAKRTRAAFKRLKEWGAIPPQFDYRARSSKYAGGQSVYVSVDGVTDGDRVRETALRKDVPTHIDEHLKHVLQRTVDQWNDQDIDSQIDYFQTNYYSFVRID